MSKKMLKLLKNIQVFSPEDIGVKDILISAGKIVSIQDNIILDTNVDIEIIDLQNKILVPGFIDSHVHIIGGGGEGSYRSRTPEIMLTDLTRSGITTVVGCLGTDSTTRTMSNLIAKSKGLHEEGITSYIYTGSYQIPVKTFTGSIQDDIVMIDPIIGVGEIAVSDHRSSQPSFEEFSKIVSSARVAGMLSGKAGIVNVHIGTGKRKLELLERIINETEIPPTQCIPTHCNRNRELFEASIEYTKKGGFIDMTTSTSSGPQDSEDIKSSSALKQLLDRGVQVNNITFSSDAQGSLPVFDKKGNYIRIGIGKAESLFKEVRDAVLNENIPLETALKVITSNPANNLMLNSKGSVEIGKDADLVVLDKDHNIDTVIAMGEFMIKNKQIIKKGTFEE